MALFLKYFLDKSPGSILSYRLYRRNPFFDSKKRRRGRKFLLIQEFLKLASLPQTSLPTLLPSSSSKIIWHNLYHPRFTTFNAFFKLNKNVSTFRSERDPLCLLYNFFQLHPPLFSNTSILKFLLLEITQPFILFPSLLTENRNNKLFKKPVIISHCRGTVISYSTVRKK